MPGIELNWPNKNRVLYHVPQRGDTHKPVYYGDPGAPAWPDHRPLLRLSTHGDPDPDPNRLIMGDNLTALQALLDEGMAGRFQFIYIDPPYNTENAFEHYDDSYEHTIWLGMMRDRLKLLQRLLRPNGVICSQIDDGEGGYLKLLMDQIFGRDKHKNITTFYVQVRYPEKTLKRDMKFHKLVEQIHCYANDEAPFLNQPGGIYEFDKYVWRIREINQPKVLDIAERKVEFFAKGDYAIERVAPSYDGLKEIWATGTILDGNSSGRFFRDYLEGRVTEDGLGVLYKVHGMGEDNLWANHLDIVQTSWKLCCSRSEHGNVCVFK